jgi:hypothetical protein
MYQNPYQIQSSYHGAQVDGEHDKSKPVSRNILNVVVLRVTLRHLALGVFVVSHGREVVVDLVL